MEVTLLRTAHRRSSHELSVELPHSREFAALPAVRTAPRLRPTNAWCGRMGGEDLARSCLICHVLKTTPLGYHQKQRLPVHPSEHASEAATIKMDRLQDLTPFSYAHATLV